MLKTLLTPRKPVHRSAALVYRRRRGRVEFLFVTSAHNPDRLVLPGGHVEPDEPPQRTAVRETREEAGVSVVIKARLGSYRHPTRRGPRPRTALYLASYHSRSRSYEGRRRVWLGEDELDGAEVSLPPKALRLIRQARRILPRALVA